MKKKRQIDLHRMKHEIHDLNQMELLSYRYPDPRMHTCVRFEEFVGRNI